MGDRWYDAKVIGLLSRVARRSLITIGAVTVVGALGARALSQVLHRLTYTGLRSVAN